jgi:hypothetical protein
MESRWARLFRKIIFHGLDFPKISPKIDFDNQLKQEKDYNECVSLKMDDRSGDSCLLNGQTVDRSID